MSILKSVSRSACAPGLAVWPGLPRVPPQEEQRVRGLEGAGGDGRADGELGGQVGHPVHSQGREVGGELLIIIDWLTQATVIDAQAASRPGKKEEEEKWQHFNYLLQSHKIPSIDTPKTEH